MLLGVGSMKCLLGGVHVHLNFQLALTQGFVVISTGVCMLGALLRSTPEARMVSFRVWQVRWTPLNLGCAFLACLLVPL